MAAKKRKERKRTTHSTNGVTHGKVKSKLWWFLGAGFAIACFLLLVIQSLRHATSLQDQTSESNAFYRKGMTLIYQNKVQESLAIFDECISVNPQHADCYNSKAGALRMLGRTNDALATLQAGEKNISIPTDLAILYGSLFLLFKDANQNEQAVEYIQRSIEIQPMATKYLNWATVVDSHKTKVDLFNKALELDPHYFPAFCSRANSFYFLGEWEFIERDQLQVERYQQGLIDADKTERNTNSSACLLPYFTTYMNISASLMKDTALQYAKRRGTISKEGMLPKLRPSDIAPVFDENGNQIRKLRIGYVSSDLNIHPVGRNMMGVFMAHDKNKFDVYAFSTQHPSQADEITKAMQPHVTFVDISHIQDYATAARMIRREYQIDVLIDLNGWTMGHRLRMFAARPAPVQMTHGLGFVGTVGAPESFDYFITDSIVSPPKYEEYYTEKLIRLPQAYLPASHAAVHFTPEGANYNPANTNKRQVRVDNGLPESDDTFIYCSFQGFHRISRESFETWLRILLKSTPNSILWMTAPTGEQRDKLLQRASDFGIENATSRIIFSDQVNPGKHLIRAQACDLHLDSWPYNSHSTGVDVLWAGVPLLVYLSDYQQDGVDNVERQSVPKMASRVSAGLLDTLGMPQLITSSIDDYEAEAVRYATDRVEYTRLRNELLTKRLSSPLYDLISYARVHEAAYLQAFQRFYEGKSPESIDVAPYEPPPRQEKKSEEEEGGTTMDANSETEHEEL